MSDDDLSAAVRDELDPTPASEADWPVSRRDTLRALAGVGALAVGPGGAQGAAGTGIADEAYFSNYGWESTAEGGVLTIDGAEFTFDGSETIGLPDGGTGRELVTEGGATASEVIGPDGSVLYDGDVIPDSVVDNFEEYLYEDQSNTLSSYYGGSLTGYSRQQTTVYQGQYSLEATSSAGSILSTSGLPRYPQTDGDPFSAVFRTPSTLGSDFPGIVYSATTDNPATADGYLARVDLGTGSLQLFRVDDGNPQSVIDDTAVSISATTWYRLAVTSWTAGGSHSVELQSADGNTTLGSVSGSDDTYDAEGVGWWPNSDETIYFDKYGLD